MDLLTKIISALKSSGSWRLFVEFLENLALKFLKKELVEKIILAVFNSTAGIGPWFLKIGLKWAANKLEPGVEEGFRWVTKEGMKFEGKIVIDKREKAYEEGDADTYFDNLGKL